VRRGRLPVPAEQGLASVPEPRTGSRSSRAPGVAKAWRVLGTPLLGCLIALLTWPVAGLAPVPSIDPSWVAGLYMEAAKGMHSGTQIVFTYGPLGFLDLPSLYEIGLGRLSFAWTVAVQLALCIGLLWASRRAFGLIAGLAVTLFVAALGFVDPILIVATVVGAAALLGDWSPRAHRTLALGAGALTGLEMLNSFRAGPTLLVMSLAVLLALPGRRRALIEFAGALLASFLVLWFVAGQGIGNLDDYLINTANIVGGYSATMVYIEPGRWWQVPAFALGLAAVAVLCAAAVWRRDNARRVGLALMVAVVVFINFKHSVVRASPGNSAVFLAALLAIGLALAAHVRRWIALGPVLLLVGLAVLGNGYILGTKLEFAQRASNFGEQLKIVALPGRAAAEQQEGRESMKALYALTPRQLALLRSGTVHVAPWEAGVVWAYDLDWDPLPVFQQYSAYTSRLDDLNAAKLDSPSAPELILWENAPVVDPGFAAAVNFPGAIDARVPAWESPREMVRMLCRYRVVKWNERWAILRHGPDRCGPERHLETIVTNNAEGVRLPSTGPREALVVRVDGLAVSGLERVRAFLFRATNRNVILNGNIWNMVGETAADGLLLRVPPGVDYPGPFALDSEVDEVAFLRGPGFLTGVDGSTELTLHFSALPLDAAAILPVAKAQKRRVQRSIR
jgi:hypothetical protein